MVSAAMIFAISTETDVHARDLSMRAVGGTYLAAPAIASVAAPPSPSSPHGQLDWAEPRRKFGFPAV